MSAILPVLAFIGLIIVLAVLVIGGVNLFFGTWEAISDWNTRRYIARRARRNGSTLI